jgi:hypothetical protein
MSKGAHMKKLERPVLKPMAITLAQFHTVLYPCSRAKAHQLVRSGKLESFVGDNGCRMVLVTKARAFVNRKAAAGGAVPPRVSAQKSTAGKKGRAIQLAAKDHPSQRQTRHAVAPESTQATVDVLGDVAAAK